jgi:predicted sulfurtransferase
MEKIILFYKFVPIADTESVLFWQRALCEKHGLKGRILISKHGINGTLGGDFKQLKYYTRELKKHSLFMGISFKWSDGRANDFPRLSIKVRDEIVTFGDDGLWEGKLHVFDDRMVHSFSDSAKDIGDCIHCGGKTSQYRNCADPSCNRLVLICENCSMMKTYCTNKEHNRGIVTA